METYVSLINWTDQGVRNFRDSTQRAEDYAGEVEKAGGQVRELLWTVGEYDIVSVSDFPDEETAAATLLRVNSSGNIRSTTLRAFGTDEMADIIRHAS